MHVKKQKCTRCSSTPPDLTLRPVQQWRALCCWCGSFFSTRSCWEKGKTICNKKVFWILVPSDLMRKTSLKKPFRCKICKKPAEEQLREGSFFQDGQTCNRCHVCRTQSGWDIVNYMNNTMRKDVEQLPVDASTLNWSNVTSPRWIPGKKRDCTV